MSRHDYPEAHPVRLILAGAELAAERLRHYIASPMMGTLKEITDSVILHRLKEYDGNKMRAARSLGINVKTLYNRLEKIDP